MDDGPIQIQRVGSQLHLQTPNFHLITNHPTTPDLLNFYEGALCLLEAAYLSREATQPLYPAILREFDACLRRIS